MHRGGIDIFNLFISLLQRSQKIKARFGVKVPFSLVITSDFLASNPQWYEALLSKLRHRPITREILDWKILPLNAMLIPADLHGARNMGYFRMMICALEKLDFQPVCGKALHRNRSEFQI
ncbi:hypothetical protein A8B75_00495 [Sphingomonadales bacterium EhC05]|nr:hypothetical protein A8B75_00495 [Sphingomonadales bacterium EhC05]